MEDLPQDLDTCDELRQIGGRAQVGGIDQGLIEGIAGGQRDLPAAGRAIHVEREGDAVAVRLERFHGRLGEAIREEESLQIGRSGAPLRPEKGARLGNVRREEALPGRFILGLHRRELLGGGAVE